MKLTIDTDAAQLIRYAAGGEERIPLYSREGFELVSRLWVKVGWNEKHAYTFSWMGRPIIQLPEDMVRAQEVIHQIQPDVIIETGVAHGGSLIYYASLLKLQGGGRVIGVDIEIRQANQQAIEAHPLSELIILIEGDSTAEAVVAAVAEHIGPDDTVLVILDSDHSRDHVLKELEAYHRFVTPGSYIVATDGIMRDLHDVPRGSSEWTTDHPAAAAEDFAAQHPEFALGQPPWLFNESELRENVTHWPGAWLRRL
jgi:cephalosporin hydroxylase